jgi:type I restriction enzyme S subunit
MTSGSRGWAAYYADHGEKFLRIQNVANNQLNLEDVVFVSPPESAEANRTSVKAGDVLISITADLGRTAVIPDSLGKAYINQHLAILRTSKISSVFLSGFLSSSCGKIQIQKKNRGGVKAGLNFNDIRSLVIPMPDNNLIVKYENYLSKIRLLKKLMTESLYKSCELIEVIQHQQFAKHLS